MIKAVTRNGNIDKENTNSKVPNDLIAFQDSAGN